MMYELQTWHYWNETRWSKTQAYDCLTDLEKDLMLYKLSMNLGYKIFHNTQLIEQWFDKESYRGVYNATRSDKEN